MAYPAAPGRRIPWDIDGSIGYEAVKVQSGGYPSNTPPVEGWTTLTQADINNLNNRNLTSAIIYRSGDYSATMMGVLLAVPYDLKGIFWNGYATGGFSQWSSYSTDTTNMMDGTWQLLGADDNYPNDLDEWRKSIETIDIAAVKGLMFATVANTSSGTPNTGHRALHLYGEASTPDDRLLFLDTDNSDVEFARVFDYGEKARGTITDRTVKLKNPSALTYSTVTVLAEDHDGGAADWMEFSLDDITYTPSVVIASMAPAAETLIYVRQTVLESQPVEVYDARIRADFVSAA